MIRRALIALGLMVYGFVVLHVLIFIVLGIVYVLEQVFL